MTVSSQTSKNEETVRRFFAIFEDHTPELFPEVVSPDYQDRGHEPPGIGPQGARDDYDALSATFGEVSYAFDAFVANDDRVAVLWTATLLHTGAFVIGGPHLLATGRRVTMRGTSFYRLADGLITEARVLVDVGAVRAQLTDPAGN